MRFEIVGKNITITDTMREKIEKKLSGLQKYLLIDPDTTARVVARVYPESQKIEVTIPTKVGILRTEVEQQDIYSAVDIALDKLEDQLRRQKTRLNRRHRDSLAESFILEEEAEDVDINVLNDSLDLRAKKENELRLGINGFIESIEDDERNTIKKLINISFFLFNCN